jgi:hypothetical protein
LKNVSCDCIFDSRKNRSKTLMAFAMRFFLFTFLMWRLKHTVLKPIPIRFEKDVISNNLFMNVDIFYLLVVRS